MDRIEQESPAELKRKLGKRLALAATLIVVLLGALAAFDYLSQLERDEASQPVLPVQPRLGPSISSGRPNAPALPQEEPITPSPDLAPKDLPPVVEPPPIPEVAALPSATPKAVPAPAPGPAPIAPAPVPKPAVVSPTAPVAAGIPPVKPAPLAPAVIPPIAPPAPPAVAAVPEDTTSAPVLGAPASARLPVPAAAVPATPRPVLSRLASGFILQAGVFASTERAEELKAKLMTAGVPVSIETRVHVGPFSSQKEADAARKKIRELGIDSILIPPRAGRR